MKLLFVHDHILHKVDNDFYSPGGLSNDVMHRYLYHDDDTITLYSRFVEEDDADTSKLVKVNDDRVFCKPSKLYHSPKDYLKKNKVINEELNKLVDEADFLILRVPSFLGYFAYDLALKKNKKYVLEMVACPWDSLWNHSSILGKFLAPIMYFKTKKVCKNAKNIIYVSNEFLQNRYPTKGKSIACSNVNLKSIDDKNLEKRLRKINNKKENDKYIIGLIGSLNVNFKGHREAILMMKDLLSNGHNVELHCLGGGDKKRWESFAEKNGVKENVYFDGTLPSGEPVLNWLDNLDIYIIPSLQEGLPRALIEAMSRGCPAVGMHTGGIPELINKKFVCQRKNYKQLTSCVESLVNDKKLMINTAKENFNNSRQYLKKDLDNRRKDFITNIINN